MSIDEKKTLAELLSDPRIRPIASDAITGMDLKEFIQNYMIPLKEKGEQWGFDLQYLMTGVLNQ
ncbi:MAG: hypothetical protein II141_09240, partial [Clostridia bacterium]|nr:hypothetical protein [Clostridia bacterium]